MKKLSVVLLVLCVSVSVFSQGSGDLENQFYFRFGISKPTKSYYGIDNDSFWDDTKRSGGVFELGSIFMLNSLPFPDGLRLGINADYAEFTYHQFKYDDATFGYTTGIFSIASKIGPSISYSPVSGLVVDAYFKGKLNWLSGMATVNDNSMVEDEGYAGFMGLGYATGLNIRYKFLMLAFEFNKVKTKLKNVDESSLASDYVGDFNSTSEKTSMPHWSLTLGFSF